MVEHLPSQHEFLSSKPQYCQKTKTKPLHSNWYAAGIQQILAISPSLYYYCQHNRSLHSLAPQLCLVSQMPTIEITFCGLVLRKSKRNVARADVHRMPAGDHEYPYFKTQLRMEAHIPQGY
jgi:hypothetical protein